MNRREYPSFKENHARLQAVQKPGKGAPLYSLIVNRPMGRVLAALAYKFGMKPDQVTLLSAALTLTGICLIALREPGITTAVAVTVALVLGYALDAADGQLARLRGGGSLTGEWLDHVIDAFKVAALHLAVLIMLFRTGVSEEWLLIPLVFAVANVVEFFGMLLTDLLTRNAQLRLGRGAESRSGGSRLMSALKLPTDYGVLCLVFLLLAVPSAFLWAYTALAIASAVYTVLALYVWYRRLRGVDAELTAHQA